MALATTLFAPDPESDLPESDLLPTPTHNGRNGHEEAMDEDGAPRGEAAADDGEDGGEAADGGGPSTGAEAGAGAESDPHELFGDGAEKEIDADEADADADADADANGYQGEAADADEDEDGDEDELEGDESSGLFQIKDRVKEKRIEIRTIQSLYDMMEADTIDFEPPYQRDVVWVEPRQVRLIDSIFLGCPIPALLFSVDVVDGIEYRRIIDGKQRLTSIRRFLSGALAYKLKKKNFVWKKNENYEGKGTRLQIPEPDKKWFGDQELICIEYYDLPEAQEQEIFKRVQEGVTLAAAEKLRVGDTARAQFIKDLVREYTGPGNTQVLRTIKYNRTRGRDFSNFASFVYCCDGLPNERARPNTNALQRWLDVTDELSASFMERIRDALDDMWQIGRKHKEPFTLVKQMVAPVEVMFIGVYCYITRGLPFATRAAEIRTMREEVHTKYPSIVRANATLFSWFWHYLDRIAVRPELQGIRLADLPETAPASPEPPARTPAKRKGRAAAGTGASVKRSAKKRPAIMVGDEGDGLLPAGPSASAKRPTKKRARPVEEEDAAPGGPSASAKRSSKTRAKAVADRDEEDELAADVTPRTLKSRKHNAVQTKTTRAVPRSDIESEDADDLLPSFATLDDGDEGRAPWNGIDTSDVSDDDDEALLTLHKRSAKKKRANGAAAGNGANGFASSSQLTATPTATPARKKQKVWVEIPTLHRPSAKKNVLTPVIASSAKPRRPASQEDGDVDMDNDMPLISDDDEPWGRVNALQRLTISRGGSVEI